MWESVCSKIADALGEPFEFERVRSMAGGCINRAQAVEGSGKRCFVKLNDASLLDMFEAEAEALEEICATAAIRAPRPLCSGVDDGKAWLALEHIEMGAAGTDASERMGAQLAALHRKTHGERLFGWRRDNTIGSTPQINTQSADWIEFYRERRLRFQFDLAARNGARLNGADELLERLPEFFEDYAPEPSLLHGDLWGGNASADDNGAPVIFDPASYYGDREADIAFTELFGGFSGGFYRAYNEAWPLDPGYVRRKTLYNLYHVVNHYNLFGGGYAGQAQSMIDHLLR